MVLCPAGPYDRHDSKHVNFLVKSFRDHRYHILYPLHPQTILPTAIPL